VVEIKRKIARAVVGVGLRILKGLVEIRVSAEMRTGYGKLESVEEEGGGDRNVAGDTPLQGDRVPGRGHAIALRRAASAAAGVGADAVHGHARENAEGIPRIKGRADRVGAEPMDHLGAGTKMEIQFRPIREDVGIRSLERSFSECGDGEARVE
jgi:hypothetical protein